MPRVPARFFAQAASFSYDFATTQRGKERVLRALRRLLVRTRSKRLTIARVAKEARVSWPTANRHLGGKRGFSLLVANEGHQVAPPDSRERLFASAAQCFQDAGFHQTTLDDVAARADLTKGAVYWHFRGKRDLLLSLVRDYLPRVGIDDRLWIELILLARDPDVRHALATLRGLRAASYLASLDEATASDTERTEYVARVLDGQAVAVALSALRPDAEGVTARMLERLLR